jgi:hypothetical protein
MVMAVVIVVVLVLVMSKPKHGSFMEVFLVIIYPQRYCIMNICLPGALFGVLPQLLMRSFVYPLGTSYLATGVMLAASGHGSETCVSRGSCSRFTVGKESVQQRIARGRPQKFLQGIWKTSLKPPLQQ